MNESINKRVAKFRKLAGLNQTEVAERMGMKVSTYSQMERKGNISGEKLVKLAQIFNVDIGLLLYVNEVKQIINKPNDFNVTVRPDNTVLEQAIPNPFDMETISITKIEENYIKILRNLPKEDRDEIIALIQKKYHDSRK